MTVPDPKDTPVQAQIEAAELLKELRDPCGIQTQYTLAMYEHAAEVIEKLLAALNAAAEAGGKPIGFMVGQSIAESMKMDAAEAGWRDGKTGWKDGHLIADKIEQDTIERCAQVAEWFNNVEKFTAEDVAARIRALKDKP